MPKVALMLAPGFEEIEALSVVDVLRRGAIQCDMLGFEKEVTGSHGITVKADQLWEGNLEGYDMVVLPGGMPGSKHLREDEALMREVARLYQEGKGVAAICAAPIALDKAGVLKETRFTCYDGVEKQISEGNYVKETVVVDGNLITSRGPSTALAFAYRLVDYLGGSSETLADAMLYTDVFSK